MNDKMYAEFESWWYASKYCQVVTSSESAKQAAWDGWQASRETLVIDLPSDLDWRSAVETRDICADRVRAAGLKVKRAA